MARVELRQFVEKFKISPRESEILALILDEVVNFRDIAKELSVSPSTVNNHLNSIFKKTRTKNKTELLAVYLKDVFKEYDRFKFFSRKPQILIVDDETEICEWLEEELKLHGMDVFLAKKPEDVCDLLRRRRIDGVVSDIRMPGMDGVQLLKEIRRQFGYFPFVIFMTGYSDYQTEDVLHLGASAIVKKPFDADQLVQKIFENYIEDEQQRLGWMRRSVSEDRMRVPRVLVFEKKHFGAGGVFIPRDYFEAAELGALEVGVVFSFQYKVSDVDGDGAQPTDVVGEVAWIREPGSDGNQLPGLGVRLHHLDPAKALRLREWAGEMGVNSFIPIGEATS